MKCANADCPKYRAGKCLRLEKCAGFIGVTEDRSGCDHYPDVDLPKGVEFILHGDEPGSQARGHLCECYVEDCDPCDGKQTTKAECDRYLHSEFADKAARGQVVDEVEPAPVSAFDTQVGGNHYKQYAIQPYEFFYKNSIPHHKAAIIRRIMRYDHPTGKGIEDLQKIKHEVDLILELMGYAK